MILRSRFKTILKMYFTFNEGQILLGKFAPLAAAAPSVLNAHTGRKIITKNDGRALLKLATFFRFDHCLLLHVYIFYFYAKKKVLIIEIQNNH